MILKMLSSRRKKQRKTKQMPDKNTQLLNCYNLQLKDVIVLKQPNLSTVKSFKQIKDDVRTFD